MAKSFKRFGVTPAWGLEKVEKEDNKDQVLLANSIDWTNNISDYEQTNHVGQVQGYMIYDATMDWSMSANVIHNKLDCMGEYYAPAMEITLANDLGRKLLESTSGLGYCASEATSILKSESISQTSDGALTLSLNGTVYYFGGEGDNT